MNKKTLALAPVTALIALAMVAIVVVVAIPSTAEATQLQCGSTECANGAAIAGQGSGTLKFAVATQEANGDFAGEIACTSSELGGTLEQNQVANPGLTISKGNLVGCTAFGFQADAKTNASASAPWQLTLQQPDAGGTTIGHLAPAAGSTIQLTVQPQFFGSITTCVYSASTIQLTGKEQTNSITVTGTKQFEKQSGSSLCAIYGDLTGGFVTESNNDAVVLHMS